MYSRTKAVFLMAFTGLLLAACSASGPKIYTDQDPNVLLNQYRTFGFYNPMSIEGTGYSTLFGQTFREAIGRELRAKGYVESDKPQLAINVSARLAEKTKVTTTHDPYYGGYYGYRRGRYAYGTWGTYGYGTSTHVSQYTEGTVNVDIVDLSETRMVWEGVAIGRLKGDRSNAEVRQAINEGVTTMFADFPARAR